MMPMQVLPVSFTKVRCSLTAPGTRQLHLMYVLFDAEDVNTSPFRTHPLSLSLSLSLSGAQSMSRLSWQPEPQIPEPQTPLKATLKGLKEGLRGIGEATWVYEYRDYIRCAYMYNPYMVLLRFLKGVRTRAPTRSAPKGFP